MRTYFYTFRTYATFLPGEDGAVSRKSGRMARNEPLLDSMREISGDPVRLNARIRAEIHDAIFDFCLANGIVIDALAVMPQHVHALVTTNCSMDYVISELKRTITARFGGVRLWARSYAASEITNFESWKGRLNYTRSHGSRYLMFAKRRVDVTPRTIAIRKRQFGE